MPIKLKETEQHAERSQKSDVRVVRRKNRVIKQAEQDLSGRVFADLTTGEKDDILRALAVQAGILEE